MYLCSKVKVLISDGLDVRVGVGSVAATRAVLLVAAVNQLLLRIITFDLKEVYWYSRNRFGELTKDSCLLFETGLNSSHVCKGNA